MNRNSFLNRISDAELKGFIPLKTVSLAPKLTIFYTLDNRGNSAYTRVALKDVNKYRVFIGGELIAEAINLPEEIDKTSPKFKDYITGVLSAMRGLFLHELGHLLFTDMFCKLIPEYKEEKYRNFLHHVHNLLEDIAMEKAMEAYYSPSKYYFSFLKNTLFKKQADSYINKPGVNSFLNYLLLKLRLGKAFIGENVFYNEHSDEIFDFVKAVLTESDPTKRVEKSILFGEWLIKYFGSECEDTMYEEEYSTEEPKGSPSGSSPMKSPEASCSEEDVKESFSSSSGSTPSIGSSIHEAEDSCLKDKVESSELSKEAEEFEESFNQTLGSGDDTHVFLNAQDVLEPNTRVFNEISKLAAETSTLSIKVADSFRCLKAKAKPKLIGGFSSGKLDIRRAMKNSLTKDYNPYIFKQKVPVGKEADPMVYLLVDNSGSMSYGRSKIATYAALAFSQACESLKIPYEVSCFTQQFYGDRACQTIRIKRAEDSLDKVINNFGVIHEDLYNNYTYDRSIVIPFGDNTDEVNLFYIWKDYRKKKPRDKLLIVLSDGATVGSTQQLKEVVRQITDDGILTLGIGLNSTAVTSIYPESKVFNTISDLEELPSYLASVLYRFVKGGDR